MPTSKRLHFTPTDWMMERLNRYPEGKRSEIVRQALTEYLLRHEEKEETEMLPVISCRPGESVFEARDRGVAEGKLPDGSLIYHDGPGRQNPTCPHQVGIVKVRPNERFAVYVKPQPAE